jgi:hypothetical protein
VLRAGSWRLCAVIGDLLGPSITRFVGHSEVTEIGATVPLTAE